MVAREQEGLQEYRALAYLYRPIAHRIPSTACTQATIALLEISFGMLADGLISIRTWDVFSSIDPWCGMRSSRVVRASAKVATVVGSILASSDTVESEGWQMKQCWITFITIKIPKKFPFNVPAFTHGSKKLMNSLLCWNMFQSPSPPLLANTGRIATYLPSHLLFLLSIRVCGS